MQLSIFRQAVADFMNRDITLWGAFPSDKLTIAANMMKAYAQRLLVFENAKTSNCTLAIDKTAGGSLDSVLDSTGAAIRVRNLKRAFITTVAGTPFLFPSKLITRDQQINSLGRQVENIDIRYITAANFPAGIYSNIDIVVDGRTLFIWPWPANVFTGQSATITLDVVKWLPDYVNANDEDFFLKECLDWALYQTAIHANTFLKEDQRIPLNIKYAADLWNSVVSWNTSQVDISIPVDLE